MILTILANPSLDKTITLPYFVLGRIYRTADVLVLPGGKGFNFARALHNFAQPVQICTHFGGQSGQLLRAAAQREGLVCFGPRSQHEARNCLTIVDPTSDGAPTEIYEHGLPPDPDIWDHMLAEARTRFADATALAICGSFPPGITPEQVASLVALAREAALPVLLDIRGRHLRAALAQHPTLLKINQHEAGEVVGRTLSNPLAALEAAHELQRMGARQVVITLGKQGAVGLSDSGESCGWQAPSVRALYPTGSGDSFFAGLVTGLHRGQSFSEALKLGIASGTANTLQPGAGRLDQQQVSEMLASIQPLSLQNDTGRAS